MFSNWKIPKRKAPTLFLSTVMFSGFSGIIDRFATFMREPVYSLGNSISDYIYSPNQPDPSLLQEARFDCS